MFVKICGITREEDALLAVAVGADALGFIFAPSARQVPPGRVAEIVRRLPPEVVTVGVFRNELPERVIAIAHQAGLRAVQLHGNETPEMVAAVRAEVPMVIKAVAAGSPGFDNASAYGADAVLVDAPTPGAGKVFDWGLAEDAPSGVRLIMAGGLDPDNVAAAIDKVRPWGVDVATGVERLPGVKDPVLVRSFIRNARNAAASERVAGTGHLHGGDRPLDEAPSAPVWSDRRSVAAAGPDSGDDAEPYDWQEDATWR